MKQRLDWLIPASKTTLALNFSDRPRKIFGYSRCPSEEGIQAWRHLIDGNVDIVEFESGHFFYDEDEKFTSELRCIVQNVLDKNL